MIEVRVTLPKGTGIWCPRAFRNDYPALLSANALWEHSKQMALQGVLVASA